MLISRSRCFLVAVLLLLLAAPSLGQWTPIGPWGGNARALAYDPFTPGHVLLGAPAGAIFESTDGGRNWHYFVHLGLRHELMPENILFDTSRQGTIYVAGWNVTGAGGGFWVSRNGGRSWSQPAQLRDRSIQALTLAASSPGTIVAGALDGLYRSLNYGESWERITPAGHADLKNFESVAVDEHNRDVIYAGTWHLPWKTTDGGAHWFNIKQGVIDDSDVFSIILDHSNQSTVFLSACSGIYKSENAGELFHKVQGIPGTARRTRVLEQDPVDAMAVYAGTTEGLWKTTDGGRNFHLISPPNYILNDVLVEAQNPHRVLIATDRGGVYSSDDAGASFHPSNHGFSKRQVSALVADQREPGTLYAAVLNDKEFGGVFRYRAGEWTQFGKGLEGLEVFDLAQSPNGALMAATNRGVYLYESASGLWAARTDVVNQHAAAQTRVVRKVNGKLIQPTPRPPIVVRSSFKGRASAIAFGERWYAATENGLLRSEDQGKTWQGGAFNGEKDGGEKELQAVAARGALVVTAGLHEVWQSQDGARNFVRLMLPTWVTRLYGVAIATDGALWVASREGALRYDAATNSWEHVLAGLPAREVTSFRSQGELLLATADGMESVALSRDQGKSWQVQPTTGYEVSGAVLEGGRLYLATRHHGVLAGGVLAGAALSR